MHIYKYTTKRQRVAALTLVVLVPKSQASALPHSLGPRGLNQLIINQLYEISTAKIFAGCYFLRDCYIDDFNDSYFADVAGCYFANIIR